MLFSSVATYENALTQQRFVLKIGKVGE